MKTIRALCGNALEAKSIGLALIFDDNDLLIGVVDRNRNFYKVELSEWIGPIPSVHMHIQANPDQSPWRANTEKLILWLCQQEYYTACKDERPYQITEQIRQLTEALRANDMETCKRALREYHQE